MVWSFRSSKKIQLSEITYCIQYQESFKAKNSKCFQIVILVSVAITLIRKFLEFLNIINLNQEIFTLLTHFDHQCNLNTKKQLPNTKLVNVPMTLHCIGGLQLAAILVDIAKHVHNSTRI